MLYLVALRNFSCMRQILVNSFFIFILLQIFSNFSCYGFLDPSFKSGHLILKYMFFLISLILISHFDINFLFKCFPLYNQPLHYFSLLTLLRFSVAKTKISLRKCHIALENIWIVFKYLLILISNIIPQW